MIGYLYPLIFKNNNVGVLKKCAGGRKSSRYKNKWLFILNKPFWDDIKIKKLIKINRKIKLKKTKNVSKELVYEDYYYNWNTERKTISDVGTITETEDNYTIIIESWVYYFENLKLFFSDLGLKKLQPEKKKEKVITLEELRKTGVKNG